MVVESSRTKQESNLEEAIPAGAVSAATPVSGSVEMERHLLNIISSFPKQCVSDSAISQREVLLIACLQSLISDEDSDQLSEMIDAMLLHTIVLTSTRLIDRRFANVKETRESTDFLRRFCQKAVSILTSPAWEEVRLIQSLKGGLIDFLDGRLFFSILSLFGTNEVESRLENNSLKRFMELKSLLIPNTPSGNLIIKKNGTLVLKAGESGAATKSVHPVSCEMFISYGTVLPFSNPVFDTHLVPIRLETDSSGQASPQRMTSKVFKELSHWHNHRRRLTIKGVSALSDREKFFANRRNQYFMAEMQKYAASLTMASGGMLEPETMFVESQKQSSKLTNRSSHTTSKSFPKPQLAHKQTGKTNAKGGKSTRDAAAAYQQQKKEITAGKHNKAWEFMRQTFDHEPKMVLRYSMVEDYFNSLSTDAKKDLEAEITAYLINCLVHVYAEQYDAKISSQNEEIVAIIWNLIKKLSKLSIGLNQDIVTLANRVIDAFGLPTVKLEPISNRSCSFSCIDILSARNFKARVLCSPLEFQLRFAGPYMERDMDSADDNRVRDFRPDKWQRDVLDHIDSKRSLLVVAPTSAGKTFIS